MFYEFCCKTIDNPPCAFLLVEAIPFTEASIIIYFFMVKDNQISLRSMFEFDVIFVDSLTFKCSVI